MTRETLYLACKRFVPHYFLSRAVNHWQRIGNYLKYGDYHFFMAVALEIDTGCNRRCFYCPHSTISPQPGRNQGDSMSREMFALALRRLAEIEWTGIVAYHWYNEPLLDPRLEAMVYRTKEVLPKSMPRIYTNGDYLTIELAQRLIRAGVVNFSVSDHNLHQESNWHRRIKEIVDRFPSYFTVNRIFPVNADYLLNNRGGLVDIPEGARENVTHSNCTCIEGNLTIDYLGRVYLCGNDYLRDYEMGDIRRQGLREIWDDSYYKQLRRELRKGIARVPMCKRCLGIE
jgi:radical SAM protein with 4Fe4S-binding SPASM domain